MKLGIRPRPGLLALLLVPLAVGWPVASAGAASSVEAGWWTSAPIAAPDVPSGGLAVQGGAGGPVAYSAVSFALDPGETPRSITLSVTANSATTPSATLQVCPLTASFTAASGGAMSQAPAYWCDTKVTAAPSSDGKSYTFDVSALPATGSLAVAILPTQPTDRVVFDPPTASSLSSTPGAAGQEATPPDTSATAVSSGADSLATTPAIGSFDVPPAPAPDITAPAAPPVEAPRQVLTAAPASATVRPASSHGHTRLLALLAVGLALVAATLWWSAGSQHEPVPET